MPKEMPTPTQLKTPRTMRNLTLNLGLLNIPVAMVSAQERENDSTLNRLHAKCQKPISMQMQCGACNEDVTMDQIIHGFQYAPDRYVTIEPSELAELNQESSPDVEISSVVDAGLIAPEHVGGCYFLSPSSTAVVEVFAVLRDALAVKGRAALAEICMFNRRYTAAILPYKAAMLMITIKDAEKVRQVEAVKNYDAIPVKSSKENLALAASLMDKLYDETFSPRAVTDTYREDLRKMIDERVDKASKGQTEVAAHQKKKKRGETKATASLNALLQATVDAAKAPKARKTA